MALDELRERVQDDLRGLIAGDMIFDPVGRLPYACDAGLHEIEPLGVIAPRSAEDVAAVMRYADQAAISVHARGAGTGLAGESLGAGLLLDFSRYMRRVIEVRGDRVVVQPGVVLDELNERLAPMGRKLGPDPSGSASATLGGMIAGDSAGARSLKYGTMAGAVESLKVVLANGEIRDFGLEPWPTADTEPDDLKGSILKRVAMHLNWHADLIARMTSKSPRNRAGYALGSIARPDGIDLARLIVGSEGTLALVTEATLRTVPIPGAQGVLLLPFGRLLDAADAIATCLEFQPAACDLYDWRRLNLARDADPALRAWITDAAEAALIVGFEEDDLDVIARRMRGLSARLFRRGGLAADPTDSIRRADYDRLLNLRDVIMPQLMRSSDPRRPIPLIEDVAVPPAALSKYLQRVQEVLKAHRVNWILHAHAGCGQVHIRPFLDLADPHDRDRIEVIAVEVHEAALALGGTVSGEHGCGLTRTQFLKRQYGELEGVFREIKNAFDSKNLLNPGKIICEDPHLLTRDLRSRPAPGESVDPPPPASSFQGDLPVLNAPLLWPERGRAEHIAACNGCGSCRSQTPTLRMCPTFRALRSEAATPRAKVNLLRQIASGALDPRHWGEHDLREAADLCVHCGLCRVECPAGIDVSSLMIEAKAAYVENHGLVHPDWTFSHIEDWARLGSTFPRLAGGLLRQPWARSLIERILGLSRLRALPRIHGSTFMKRAERMGLTRPRSQEPGPRVAYFVDLFANYFDPELAEAVVAVLRHSGVNVFVPPKQRASGMPSLIVGDLERARAALSRNLKVLGDAVRDGYTIVCSEPTAALMFKLESFKLTTDLDAELVARNTMDVGEYLRGLSQRVRLPAMTESIPLKVGYHQPCHLRTLNVGTPSLDLLRAVPGIEVEFIDRGCSGIAGCFGLSRRHFRTSLRAGRGLKRRLNDRDIMLGATECGACRIQMEQGATKATLHPFKLLALAFGLTPAARAGLGRAKPRHMIT